MRVLRAGTGLCWLVAACYDPTFPLGIPCETSAQCPSTQECVDNVCGGMPADAAVPVDAPPPEPDAPAPDATPGVPDATPLQPLAIVIDQPGQIRDTYLYATEPTNNFGTEDQASVDSELDESTLLWFDVSSVPADAQVVSATLTIRTDDQASEDGGTVRVHEMLQAWTETDATFLLAAPGSPWLTSGARPPSRATAVIGSFSPAAIQTTYAVALDAAPVQGWIEDATSNLGIILVRGTSMEHVHLYTKESAFTPTLELDLLVP
jgi:hypothetical protein